MDVARAAALQSYCGHGIGALFHTVPNVPHYSKNKAVLPADSPPPVPVRQLAHDTAVAAQDRPRLLQRIAPALAQCAHVE